MKRYSNDGKEMKDEHDESKVISSSIQQEHSEQINENVSLLERKESQPLSHLMMMITSGILLVATMGVIAWGYGDVQNEKRASLSEPLHQTERTIPLMEDKTSYSTKEAVELLKTPLAHFMTDYEKTVGMTQTFINSPELSYTTAWKMDYQSYMEKIRRENSEIQDIVKKTDDLMLKEFAKTVEDIVKLNDVRYRIVVEKNGQGLTETVKLATELDDSFHQFIRKLK